MCLALFGAMADARQTAVVTAASVAASEHVSTLSNRLEASYSVRPLQGGAHSPTLAEVTEQLKRQHLKPGEAIGVIYPDIGEPFRSVFTRIIEGIEEKTKVRMHSYPIGVSFEAAELNAQLKRNGTRVVIALGRQGLKSIAGLDSDIAVIIGGILSVPEPDSHNLTGISLTPDPALLFSRLKNLQPAVKRVLVVYNPLYNEWLIKLARDAAKAQGLELLTFQARDLASAARLYETAFGTADARHDAVWLPQDATTVEETTILPLVLKESWNRGVPIFSSSLAHVKKGALFALYPNNLDLGRNLASSALSLLAGDTPRRGIVPLRDVYTAVNLRTASHIGLQIGAEQQHSFDFVYPVP